MILINGVDRTSEIEDFRIELGLERLIPDRCSQFLATQLFIGAREREINPDVVLREIRALEVGDESTRTKPAAPFTGFFLKGLWHKHYFQSSVSSMSRNLMNEIHTDEAFRQLTEIMLNSGEEYLTEEMGARLAHEMVIGNFERRSARCALTGEWIVYAPFEGKNYYLCLASHNDGDEFIASQIKSVCFSEFPFLKDIIN